MIATSPVTAPDGFYFATVPAGGPYTVQLFNPVGQIPGKSITIPSIANNQYQAVDFLNINPADPAITGYVFDSSFHGISGVKITLTDAKGKTVATTTTSSSGWYVFRFTQPGTYTVTMTVPQGYKAVQASYTMSIGQFQTVRQDFGLK